MQIDGEGIENLLIDMMFKKNTHTHTHKSKIFPCLFTWEWAKQISN
jgi:hypothetical protein